MTRSTRKNHFPHDSVERYHVEIGAPIDSPVARRSHGRERRAICPNRPTPQFPELFAKAVALNAFPDEAGRANASSYQPAVGRGQQVAYIIPCIRP